MEIKVSSVSGDSQSIKLIGDLDKAGLAEVRSELEKLVADFASKVLSFNLKEMEFINSEGIGFLIEMNSKLSEKGAKLILLAPNAHVKDVFDTVGLPQVIEVKAK